MPEAKSRFRAFGVLMSFSVGSSGWQAPMFLFMGALMSLAGPVGAYGLKMLVDAATSHDTNEAIAAALVLTATSVGLLVVVLVYLDLLFTVAEKAGAAIDKRLMQLMGGIPGLEHHERPEYIDRLDALREERARLGFMTNATAGIVRVIVAILASGFLLYRLNPILLLLPLIGFVTFLTGRKAQMLQLAAIKETAEPERLRRHLFELATSADAGQELRTFRVAPEIIARHHEAARATAAPRNRADVIGAVYQALGSTISGLAYAGAIGLVLVMAVNGSATPGDVILAVGLAATMNQLVTTAVFYGTAFVRILDLAGSFLWLSDYAATSAPNASTVVSVPPRLDHGIDIKDLSFTYPGLKTPILTNVNLSIPAGSVVALVGENGAGKTTLVKLLSRFYEPTSGQILVDGMDLSQLAVTDWRAHISSAFQDFSRFEFLARETVGIGDLPDIGSAEHVSKALVRAGGQDVPVRLTSGLETQLGRDWDGGVELSGGQWQKLALGRAMMRNQPLLLILDEPTASLDAQTEHDLFENYARAAHESGRQSGTITLLISHRFSTVRMADLIIVLDSGSVLESGSHAELMSGRGLYAELYDLQANAYR